MGGGGLDCEQAPKKGLSKVHLGSMEPRDSSKSCFTQDEVAALSPYRLRKQRIFTHACLSRGKNSSSHHLK